MLTELWKLHIQIKPTFISILFPSAHKHALSLNFCTSAVIPESCCTTIASIWVHPASKLASVQQYLAQSDSGLYHILYQHLRRQNTSPKIIVLCCFHNYQHFSRNAKHRSGSLAQPDERATWYEAWHMISTVMWRFKIGNLALSFSVARSHTTHREAYVRWCALSPLFFFNKK